MGRILIFKRIENFRYNFDEIKQNGEVQRNTMEGKEFLKLVIETIQVEDYEQKDDLVELLKVATLKFQKTDEFTRQLWNHCKEYMIFYIVPEKLIALKNIIPYLSLVYIKSRTEQKSPESRNDFRDLKSV